MNGDFVDQIHTWYAGNKRDLPWRTTNDPYIVWVSEIILQQTRVVQGIDYFYRFVEKFPSVSVLAQASEDEVLKLWQGLGYYSRARNLHYTAKYIHSELNGTFPFDYESIIKLKGIGEYTAAAIASISFRLPYAVIDGNVYRVLSRYFGIADPIDTNEGKKVFRDLAAELISDYDPGVHNQAMMEFGALHCVPTNPDCVQCPVNSFCHAYLNGTVDKLPVKRNKTKVRERYFNYYVVSLGETVFLKKRTSNDIWRNLYEFPMIETKTDEPKGKMLEQEFVSNIGMFEEMEINEITEWNTHLLSHQRIFFRFFVFHVSGEKKISSYLIKVNKKDIFNFAVPKLLENFINNSNLFRPDPTI